MSDNDAEKGESVWKRAIEGSEVNPAVVPEQDLVSVYPAQEQGNPDAPTSVGHAGE